MSEQQTRIQQIEKKLAAIESMSAEMQAMFAAERQGLQDELAVLRVEGDFVGGDKAQGDLYKANRDINNTYINQIIRRADSGLDEEQARVELERYLDWVMAQNGTITLRGVQHQGRQVVEMPLDSVYVPLEAEMAYSSEDEHGADRMGVRQREAGYGGRREMQLNEVLGYGERLIITGGPGCGKTTVLMHIAATLAEALAGNRPELVQEKLGLNPEDGIPLPILIPLNRYANYRREHQADDPYERTLAAYVSHYLIERSGLSALLHQLDEADFFQRLLDNDRSLKQQAGRLLAEFHKVPNDRKRLSIAKEIKILLSNEQTLWKKIFSLLKRWDEVPTKNRNAIIKKILLSHPSVILLLDGLDEVPNETERVKVTEAIENLLAGESALRVVATCRTAAYEGRTALGSRFREVQVQPLNDDHVARLITQAYAAVYPQDEIKRRRQTAELLSGIREMEAARRQRMGTATEPLVSSPLLVRMMLLVHLNERRLPEQRAELYWKATENMLLPDYQSDTQVREAIGGLVGGKLRHLELVQHVAFYMHLRGQEVGREIDEHELKRLLARDETFADLVGEFIAVTRQRGTLMEENAGSYRFIHLGFQEFLVARYMAEVLLYEQRLTDFLEEEDRLADSWWREPILLLAGYLAVTNTKQAEWLVRYLAGLLEQDEDEEKDGDHSSPTEPADGGVWRWLRQQFTVEQPQEETEEEVNTEDLASVALAGKAVIEWPNVRPGLRAAVMHKLEAVITGGDNERSLSPKQRAEFGRQLSVVGDPRPGVGVKDGLPDIVWGGMVPAGRYKIGGDSKGWNTLDEQGVAIAHSYQLARYVVTNAQFDCFVNAPDFADERWWQKMPPKYQGDVKREPSWPLSNHPRVDVNWYEAVAFCRWLSSKLGYEVRLPHEYEWEVAARYAGEGRTDDRAYPWGDTFAVDKANISKEVGQTTAVGLYPGGRQPELGLDDMSGNVWEWCLNKFEKPEKAGVDNTGDHRVVRGGSLYYSLNFARAAYRDSYYPDARNYGSSDYRYNPRGFRVLRPVTGDL